MIGIYKITNKHTGKVYIGQSDNIERRLTEHKRKRSQTIDNYINVLGVENFNFEILEECSKEELDFKEQFYIQKYNSKETGYNFQIGGVNNSQGEGNGRTRLTEEDIRYIRTCYSNHESQKNIYERYFKDKITKNQFQGIWQGRSWSSIMPEVYTKENKQYYRSEQNKTKVLLTKEEVLEYRKYYMTHTLNEVYNKFIKDKGKIYKRRTFEKILTGDVRENSIYNEVPVYKKMKKTWELKGEAVSTIPGAGE